MSILLVTDNLSSSYALTTGRTRDVILASCAHELWLEAARSDHIIKIKHRPGDQIPLADALSRASVDPQKSALANRLTRERNLVRIAPKLHGYCFFSNGI